MLDYLIAEIRKKVIGLDWVVERLVIALIIEGHVLLEGPPGIAKTTLAKTFAETLDLTFRRIQFVPDLLPSDITGYYVYRNGKFEFVQGPIFANIILADEINRAPPKTQAALLEAMQEKQVTIEGKTFSLPKPFMVIATQNPIEEEGVYPLPAAQLDRFLFKININYPPFETYKEIVNLSLADGVSKVNKVLTKEAIEKLRESVKYVKVSPLVIDYIIDLVKYINTHKAVKFGISPRGAIFLVKAAQARALIEGRDYVITDDIKQLIYDTFNHRIYLKEEFAIKGIDTKQIIDEALRKTKVPEERV